MRGKCLSKVRVSYLLLISLSPWLCASFVEIASAGIEFCTPTIHFPFRPKRQSSFEFGTKFFRNLEKNRNVRFGLNVHICPSCIKYSKPSTVLVSSKQPCRLWMLNQMAHSSLLGCREFFRIHSIQSVKYFRCTQPNTENEYHLGLFDAVSIVPVHCSNEPSFSCASLRRINDQGNGNPLACKK